MKTTYKWLQELVPGLDESVALVCERYTMSGTELESVESLPGGDTMIELAVTSNRVDCLGAIGLAREIALATKRPFAVPPHGAKATGPDVRGDARVTVEDPALCPRYTALVVKGVRVGPSPAHVAARLEAIGLRPINNIVDATNLVLFERNQPIHAFDLAKVKGRHIIVRRARAGEKILALNGKEYALTPDMLAICDEAGPTAIAGVMGGAHSEIGPQTTDVLIETAAFDAASIRRTARALGLHSDASYRFERGLDPHGVPDAAYACARLIVELAGGSLSQGIIDVSAPLPPRRTVVFRPAAVERTAGFAVDAERAAAIFRALGCEVSAGEGGSLRVLVPTWRNDLEREIDLVEEVVRIEGLHNVPLGTAMGIVAVKEPKSETVRRRLMNRLIGAGFVETLTTSFVSESEARMTFFGTTEPIVIRNAMRSDENALRQSLLPSLLRVRKTNQDHGNASVRLAEATVIYLQESRGKIPEHRPIVGLLLDRAFRDARGVVETIAESLQIDGLSFEPLDALGAALLDVECGAAVRRNGQIVGYVGRPVAAIVAGYDLKARPIYAELKFDFLVETADLTRKFRAYSSMPAVERDLAVVIEKRVAWGALEAAIRGLGLADLESLVFFDEYKGKQVAEGKKSLAFRLTYRAADRTLTGEEVEVSQARVVRELAERFGADIRK